MPITSDIIQACAVCPGKAFLSLYPDPGGASRTPQIQQQFRDARAYDPNLLGDGRSALIEAIIRTGDFEAHPEV
jgi:hypothetical protein